VSTDGINGFATKAINALFISPLTAASTANF